MKTRTRGKARRNSPHAPFNPGKCHKCGYHAAGALRICPKCGTNRKATT